MILLALFLFALMILGMLIASAGLATMSGACVHQMGQPLRAPVQHYDSGFETEMAEAERLVQDDLPDNVVKLRH